MQLCFAFLVIKGLLFKERTSSLEQILFFVVESISEGAWCTGKQRKSHNLNAWPTLTDYRVNIKGLVYNVQDVLLSHFAVPCSTLETEFIKLQTMGLIVVKITA